MSINLLIFFLLFSSQLNPVTVRGEIVCMAEEDFVENQPQECVLKVGEDEHWILYRSITSEALFVDKRLHERHLEVTGELRDDGSLEVFQIRSIIAGQLHDVHYWCDTCAIRANAPGPCWCCYQPFEFRETPIKGSGLPRVIRY